MQSIAFFSRDNWYWAGVFTKKMILFYLHNWFQVTLYGSYDYQITHKNFSFVKIFIPWSNFLIKEPYFVIYSIVLYFQYRKFHDIFIYPFRHGVIDFSKNKKIISVFHTSHWGSLKWHIRALFFYKNMSLRVLFIHVLSIIFHLLFSIFDVHNVIFSDRSGFVDPKSFLFPKLFKKRYIFLRNYFEECSLCRSSYENKISLLYIWRLDPLKWIDVLCSLIQKSHAEISNKIWSFELQIIGDGILYNHLKKYRFVHLVWKIDNFLIKNYYCNADLFLFPSFYENQPIVLWDAISFWIPFISTCDNVFYSSQIDNSVWVFKTLDHFIDSIIDFSRNLQKNDTPSSYRYSFKKKYSQINFESDCLSLILC